ncbi:AMIN domain-containing protein [Malonomonas rubra DSM 5091]|uniref:AMIN domain-containing protein n=1 Tax=Malonomonas rubra DSM 5091 TaxID=1122189 RepID=A0A1M6KFE2_MALRU|nr:DUF1302 family protein [Malonomonas rubra]SHJ57639.1 AMIN domain-containing protein [Malonomonas rubra DSM 5091]
MKFNLIKVYRHFRVLFGYLVFSLFFLPGVCHAAQLEDIKLETDPTTTEIILILDENVRFTQHTLAAKGRYPDRCYIDLFSTSRSPSLQSTPTISSQHVERIRTGDHATKLRIVFDLKQPHPCTVTTSEEPFTIKVSFSSPLEATSEKLLESTENSEAQDIPANHSVPAQEPNDSEIEAPTTLPNLAADSEEEPVFFFAGDESLKSNKPDIWGWVKFFAAQDTNEDDAEDHHLSRARGRLGADWQRSLSNDQTLLAKGSIDVDRLFYDANEADDETEFKLHEAYLQLNGRNWDISFGKQRVRWGKSDQLSPVDTINPQDFRQSLAVDLEERAIPSWMLRSRWHGDSFGLETVVQPWFEQSEIDYFDSDWALFRNLRQAINDNPSINPLLQNYASTLYVDDNKPTKNLENISAGLRLKLQTEQTDFAVSYHYGWETLPTIEQFSVGGINYNGDPDSDLTETVASITPFPPVTNRIEATYKRQQTIGFEWETSSLDPFGFRGEIAYKDEVTFLNSTLTSTRSQVTHLVTGVDYTTESEWYFNIQGSWQHIHSYDNDILYFDKDTVALLGEISKPVWRGNLELSAKYNYVMTDKSSFVQPSATLKYFRNTELEIGVMVYSGDGETLLGSYDKADQIYGIVKISF